MLPHVPCLDGRLQAQAHSLKSAGSSFSTPNSRQKHHCSRRQWKSCARKTSRFHAWPQTGPPQSVSRRTSVTATVSARRASATGPATGPSPKPEKLFPVCLLVGNRQIIHTLGNAERSDLHPGPVPATGWLTWSPPSVPQSRSLSHNRRDPGPVYNRWSISLFSLATARR